MNIRNYLLVLISTLLLWNCKKDDDTPTDPAIVPSEAQCDSCTQVITGNDANNYTPGPGEVICFTESANYSGNLVLDGGTVCNRGQISMATLHLNEGDFYNYGTLNADGLNINTDAFFYNFGTATFTNSLIVNSGGTLYNQQRIVVNGDLINNAVISGPASPLCGLIEVGGKTINNSGGAVRGNADICDTQLSAGGWDTQNGTVAASVTYCTCTPQ